MRENFFSNWTTNYEPSPPPSTPAFPWSSFPVRTSSKHRAHWTGEYELLSAYPRRLTSKYKHFCMLFYNYGLLYCYKFFLIRISSTIKLSWEKNSIKSTFLIFYHISLGKQKSSNLHSFTFTTCCVSGESSVSMPTSVILLRLRIMAVRGISLAISARQI